jgi:hypothetical protein
MLRLILATAFALSFAGIANAAEFRIGAGNVNADSTANHGDVVPYFDTYPGVFCGTKAIRVQFINSFGNVNSTAKIGRVYIGYQQHAPNGPYAAYVKVNQVISQGESTSWIKIPTSYQGTCLERVRVYAEGTESYGDHNQGSLRLAVIGTK